MTTGKRKGSEEEAKKRRRARERLDRENLADWYVRKLTVARLGGSARYMRPEEVEVMRAILFAKRAAHERLGHDRWLSNSSMRPEAKEKHFGAVRARIAAEARERRAARRKRRESRA
ncbi:MAG: hypothetical protein IPM30_14875 [Burkholderiales bacterium]|nr:hypothetical protein [Burkholderiales bacterium]